MLLDNRENRAIIIFRKLRKQDGRSFFMKRYFFAVVCGVGVLTLAGCGNQEQGKENQEIYAAQEAGQGEGQSLKSQSETEAKPETDSKSESETKLELETKSETKIESQTNSEMKTTSESDSKTESQSQGKSEPSESEFDRTSFYGTWKGKDYQACKVSVLSKEEIQNYLKDSITYGADSFSRNGTVEETENFGYEFRDCSVQTVQEDFQADLSGLAEKMKIITEGNLSEMNEGFGKYFYVIDSDHLWVYHEGVFFQMERIGS